jgi:alpha-amylase
MQKIFQPLEWVYNTNVYEVNIRQYTPEGSFESFSKHLPRLSEMGVSVLWLMPITPISLVKRQGSLGSYYACSSYTNTNPEFGTIQDFKNLVSQAHALGIKVIIDWVANHTGWDHEWTEQHPSFYKQTAEGSFYDSNGWHDVIDLNYYDAGMRTEMIKAMQFWVSNADIDGFRCDMAHLIPLDFWREARKKLDSVKPLFWLAETETPNYLSVFDCCYAWNWMHTTEAYCKHNQSLSALQQALKDQKDNFPNGTLHLFFTSNHDENSWNGTEFDKYNKLALPLAVASCLYDGVPLIYTGQEIPNYKKLKFFDKDTIDWPTQPVLHQFYKTLLDLRSTQEHWWQLQNKAILLTGGNEAAHVLAFYRASSVGKLLVIVNLSQLPQTFLINDDASLVGTYENLFTKEQVRVEKNLKLPINAADYLVLVSF